jgi:hypothetical protein
MTGNAGLNYAAWQLSRRGWHVMLTIRNARGSDLVVSNRDEMIFFGVQSKALSKRSAVALGQDISCLQSEWWIITTHANSDSPICYIMKREEVRALASQDRNGGAYWLDPPAYDRDEFKNAWHRIGIEPDAHRGRRPTFDGATPGSAELAMPEHNGIRRPRPNTLCGKAWVIFDSVSQKNGHPASIREALDIARQQGLNEGNVRAEFYQWRKFNGIGGRISRSKLAAVAT